MFTEQQLRHSLRTRTRIAVVVIAAGSVATFAYIACIPYARMSWGFLLMLPTVGLFLIPISIGSRFLNRHSCTCPVCAADVTRHTFYAIVTRQCAICDARIVEGGRAHRRAVYKRWRQFSASSFLKYWFWAWPALSAIVLIQQWLDPSALRRCQHFLFLLPLVGVIASGWTTLRTRDRRYVLPLIVSVVLLVVGTIAFWQAP